MPLSNLSSLHLKSKTQNLFSVLYSFKLSHFHTGHLKLALFSQHIYTVLSINLKRICAWSISTLGDHYNLLALSLQETVNRQTHGTIFNSTLSPSLFRALCSCQRRKSTVFDNDQLAENAAGQLVRRRRKWLWVNGNNRKSLQQQLGSLQHPLLHLSLLVYVTDYSSVNAPVKHSPSCDIYNHHHHN